MRRSKQGLPVTLIPGAYVAESHGRSAGQAGRRAKIPVGAGRGRARCDSRCAAGVGAKVDVVDAYRNVMPEAAPALLRKALQQGIDAATFTSSSSVTHLAEAARVAGIAFPFAWRCSDLHRSDHQQDPARSRMGARCEAKPHDIPGLVAAVTPCLRVIPANSRVPPVPILGPGKTPNLRRCEYTNSANPANLANPASSALPRLVLRPAQLSPGCTRGISDCAQCTPAVRDESPGARS